MKRKGLKSDFRPIVRSNTQTLIAWDFKPIVGEDNKETIFAEWVETILQKDASFEEIKDIILNYYNSIIKKEIISGFVWKGHKVWLSEENQINYKSLYDLLKDEGKEKINIVLKFGDDINIEYYKMTSLKEFKTFYIDYLSYIKETIKNGWEIKDKINWDLYK